MLRLGAQLCHSVSWVACIWVVLLLPTPATRATATTEHLGTPPSEPTVSVDFRAGEGGLNGTVSIGGTVWWSIQPTTPIRLGGRIHSQTSSPPSTQLTLTHSQSTAGVDVFGPWTRVGHTWSMLGRGAVLETACRQYPDTPTLAVFEAVALAEWTGTNATDDASSPLLQFPGMVLLGGAAQNASYTLWSGLWPLPSVAMVSHLGNELWRRRHDGPLMFTARDRTSVVVGPMNDTLNLLYTQSAPGTVTFGPSSALESVPAGHVFEVMVVAGNGPTAALRSYGELLLLASTGHPTPAPKLLDVFVSSASAWTDNGAFMYWDADGVKALPPPNTVLPQWMRSLHAGGFNARGLQLDGWWMNQTTLAPNEALFNTSWTEFVRSIGRDTPLMLYKAFFAESYDLFSQFDKVQSSKGPFYPSSADAYGFFYALFLQGKQLGMTAYETDFMSDHWLPTPGLAADVHGLATYLASLGEAGADLGVPMQWCMPTAGIALFAARLPAVTNVRVSVDYACEGPVDLNVTWPANFGIGIGSLLFASVGVVPSKDVLQTTAHQPGMIAACGSTHDQPNVELDLVLAVLSTGPVGLGDGIGETNFSLAAACCRTDGVILKPSTPLGAIDSLFVPNPAAQNHVGFLPVANSAEGDCTQARPCSPAVHQTHTVISLLPTFAEGQATLTYHYLLALNIGHFHPPVEDLWPRVADPIVSHFWREWRWSRDCTAANTDDRCGKWTDPGTVLPDVSSGSHRLTTDGSIAWRLFTMSPLLSGGNLTSTAASAWTLLGELDKVVSVSPQRFSDLHVDQQGCLGFRLAGTVGETVHVSAVSSDGIFFTKQFDGGQCGATSSPCFLCAAA
eukprot:m.14838 g.14838  ORF g.14838 m.14838 type:complete len:847 (-) comp8470_c0_seq1:104-2644(-)